MDKTLVIFRKFKEGDIVALFPEIPSSNNGYECLSYMAVGQHGGADPLLVRETKVAKPSEYRDLARELRRLGYKLKIGARIPRNSLEIRRNKIKSGE
jgi:hypothetical protein